MSFGDLTRAIAEDFMASGVPATVRLGRGHLARQPEMVPEDGTFLRVVLVPAGMAYGPPVELGGSPRAVASRKQTVDVHVHARAATQPDPTTQHEVDLALAEVLADQFVLSLFKYAEGSFEAGSGSFSLDSPLDVGFGVTLRFSIAVDIDVHDTPWVTVFDADPILQGSLLNSTTGIETEGMGVG